MGQYYFGVILDAETRKPIMANYPLGGMKLIESGLWDTSRMVYELSKKGRAYKQRVTWAGDYSERDNYDGNNLWHYVCTRKNTADKIPEAMGEEFRKYPRKHLDGYSEAWCDEIDSFFHQYVYDKDYNIRDEFRYLCNHDRKEWIDLMPFYTAEERMYWNPLAILTSDPSCRCQGGGDYFYKEDFEWYGAWNDCILSSEAMPPDGYRQITPTFPAKTRIDWNDPIIKIPPIAPQLEAPTLTERLRVALRKQLSEAA